MARRYFKALPAARRQHGRPPGGIRGGLLAWPGGTSKLWRRDGANMDGRRAEFEAACWRGSAVLQAFAGGEAPTWTADGRNSRRPVGMARRYFKVLPGGRRQHGRPPGGRFGPGGRDVPDDRRTPGDAVSQVPGAPPAPGRRHHQSKVRPCPKGAPLPFGARKRPAGRSRRAFTCTLACLQTCTLVICIPYPIFRSSQSASHVLPQPASSPQWLPHPRYRLSESQRLLPDAARSTLSFPGLGSGTRSAR